MIEQKYNIFYSTLKAEKLLMRLILMMSLYQYTVPLYETYRKPFEKAQTGL